MISPDVLAEALAAFRREFGRGPEIAVRAPGRINLIGEHTDYNGGFVFPCAIDREILVLAAPAPPGEPSRLVSRETGPAEFRVADAGPEHPPADGSESWARYAAGMAVVLQERDIPRSDILAWVQSDIPMGSGVSSSAAIELAFGLVYAGLADDVRGARSFAPSDMALLSQRCENVFVGVNCGIMDQMASACGREGHAMFLDTRSLQIVYAPLPAGVDVVLLDTNTPRALTSSAYNERRGQCETAARALGVRELRDATPEALENARRTLDPVVYRRARHVVTENERVTRFYEALARGDRGALGALLAASHASLRDDYSVSSPALDAMADAAVSAGAIGARMTGAGFGGCCVALVASENYDSFAEETLRRYRNVTGREGTALRCRAVDGAASVDI